MRKYVNCLLTVLAVGLLASPARAEEPATELAFMPRTMTVTLLNEGGKYVAIDLKHISQGGTCRMDKDATIIRMGTGSTPGTTLVRYAAPQVSSGGCPFLTSFELPNADYAAARSAFLTKEEKVEDLKKQLGEKWEELTGKKS